jgi:hypothetical protein
LRTLQRWKASDGLVAGDGKQHDRGENHCWPGTPSSLAVICAFAPVIIAHRMATALVR